MLTIYKYPIQMRELFQVEMPAGAQILHVDLQNGGPFMWVKVDTDQPMKRYNFGVFGTGHDLTKVPESEELNPVAYAPHLGSWLIEGISITLVFHLFGGVYA